MATLISSRPPSYQDSPLRPALYGLLVLLILIFVITSGPRSLRSAFGMVRPDDDDCERQITNFFHSASI